MTESKDLRKELEQGQNEVEKLNKENEGGFPFRDYELLGMSKLIIELFERIEELENKVAILEHKAIKSTKF